MRNPFELTNRIWGIGMRLHSKGIELRPWITFTLVLAFWGCNSQSSGAAVTVALKEVVPSVVQATAPSSPVVGGVSVTEYGALCDGVHDDTAAFIAALNTGNGYYTVTIPQSTAGGCRVTHSIVVTTSNSNAPSLVGDSSNQSAILADFSAWTGSDQAVIDIVSTGPVTTVWGIHNRRFGNFSLRTENVSSQAPIGMNIRTTASVASTEVDGYMPLYDATIDNIMFTGLSTAVSISEGYNLHLLSLRGINDLNGINIAGQVIQIVVDSCTFGVTTDSAGVGTGIMVTSKNYTDQAAAPQAVHIVNGSAFVDFNVDADIEAGMFVTIDHSVLDQPYSYALRVNNPDDLHVTNNYIYVKNYNESAILVLGLPANTGVTGGIPINTDGLWIEDNRIAGAALGLQDGIAFVAGSGPPRRQVHIERNRFQDLVNPMLFITVPNFSDIRSNHGAINTGPLIQFDPSGSSVGVGTVVDGNSTSDAEPAFVYGTVAPSLLAGYNYSPLGASPQTHPAGSAAVVRSQSF